MMEAESRYQGRNLLFLLLALFGPAFVLFLEFASSVVQRLGRGHPAPTTPHILLGVFFALELLCARYVQRSLWPPRQGWHDAAQYLGVLALCLFTSYCGAVVCEAFGYEVLLRLSQPR
jgi:hypothetical protein